MIIIIIKLQICGKRFCEIIVTRTFFAQQSREKQGISAGQSDIARRTALKTAINRRGEFFNQQFILFTFSEKEGNGLSISEFDIESIATPTTGATTEQ